MPQENLNNIILFPAFYAKYKFPYYTSKILNFYLKEVFPAKFENKGFSKYSKGTCTWRKRQEKGLCYSSSLEACL